ncbi:MAG: IS4 family transposase [Anaerolineaceae bacterium]|nr:IS4 family transposase [Anaerolineaceae bacterium]
MKNIDSLPNTTFSGRRFTRKQLKLVQETVQTFKHLSLSELALTLCEHLDWRTPNGQLKINSALTLLENLESHGVVTLPAKRKRKARAKRTPAFINSPELFPVNDTLNVIGPIELQRITSKEDREDWKAYIQTYHYLEYKHPVGAHIGYFIVSKTRQKLGCLLFTASAALTLSSRDRLIGWDKKHRQKLLHFIISNNRFLIFPWVNVPNLASQALSLAIKQVGNDWLQIHGYRPVLIETFVDTTKYSGTCYQAANWQYIGKTKGRGRFDPKHDKKQTIKDIYIYPIDSDWRHTLTNYNKTSSLKKKYRNDLQSSNTFSIGDNFVNMWGKVVHVIDEVASQYDEQWQIRRRIINTMLLILLIFRLVCSKNSQSYGTTIDELWDNCDKLDLPLPQKGSIAPSSFCSARLKLDESIFKIINQKIITTYAQQSTDDNTYRWLGHRIFAVDGSKITLPRKLLSEGFNLPSKNANYPQGLLSCLYQLKSQMPFDFDLVSHGNERICAQNHLSALEADDVVVYDRGYFSYVLLRQHYASKIHAIFRLQKSSYTHISNFFSSNDTDIIVTIKPSISTQRVIKLDNPNFEIIPIQIRLLKYQIDENTYCLGTTLVDQSKYSNMRDFIEAYHARWGIEELYKVSKRTFCIEDFHAKSSRGIKQEIYAHFALITMNRIFANQADADLNHSNNFSVNTNDHENYDSKSHLCMVKTNFKNCIHVFSRSLEDLLLLKTKINAVVNRVYQFIVGRNQKARPNRSYVRKSMKPESKWHLSKEKMKEQSLATSLIS